MFKKIMVLLVCVITAAAFTGCGGPEEEQPEEQIDYEIALVTDAGLIMNGGYSEVAWNTISDFGASEGVSHKYYKAAEATEDAYAETVDTAVKKGAKVIIADGYSFEQVVYDAQEKYPDVKFILIDAEPMDEESGKTKIGKNTVDIVFSSEELGYLAGYSVVREGMTELGFMGDCKDSVTMDYGYGFLQGAEKAASEKGVSVNVKYHYCLEDEDRDDILQNSNEWYDEGTQLIFACGSTVEQPVIEAAELKEKKVIAYETDKNGMSDTVIASAVKDINTSLTTVLEQYKNDEFPGGETVSYDAASKGIWLEMADGKFDNFSKSEYEDVFNDIANGTAAVKNHEAGDIGSLGLVNVKVHE